MVSCVLKASHLSSLPLATVARSRVFAQKASLLSSSFFDVQGTGSEQKVVECPLCALQDQAPLWKCLSTDKHQAYCERVNVLRAHHIRAQIVPDPE